MANYLCKRPTVGTAAGLASKLKWLLQTVTRAESWLVCSGWQLMEAPPCNQGPGQLPSTGGAPC